MSVYAFDGHRRTVVVSWPSVVGAVAHDVAPLGQGVSDQDARRLCAELTNLSRALWDVYTRPASAADHEQEREQRANERQRFDAIASALRAPNRPDAHGLLEVTYSPVEESANRTGRILHRLADHALTEAVAADAQSEVDAVVRAELGDLTGRATQACVLDRLDVSPLQVAAADEVLRADPLGDGLLSATVDPAAASVAAAHWLAAAAVVASDVAGNAPAGVFAEADDIQTVSIELPAQVVQSVEHDDRPPRSAVLDLLKAAVAAGEGVIADLPRAIAERAHLEEVLQRVPEEQREAARAAVPARTTLLDPRRPARDLLEHLLDGIASCHLVFAEYADDDTALDDDDPFADDHDDDPFADDHDDDDLGEADDSDEGMSDVDEDEEVDDERRARVAAEFADLVRDQAAATHTRLN